MKEAVTTVIDMLTEEDFHGVFQKFLERYNKCIAAGGDYFKGDQSFMRVLSIKVAIQKSLETYLMSLVYTYKKDLVLTNLQRIICHETQPSQTFLHMIIWFQVF